MEGGGEGLLHNSLLITAANQDSAKSSFLPGQNIHFRQYRIVKIKSTPQSTYRCRVEIGRVYIYLPPQLE